MSNRLFIFAVFLISLFVPIYAEITSVDEALKVVGFLDALEENYKDAFKEKNIRYALEDLLAFYENSNEFTPEQRAGLFNKLYRYFQLVEKFDAENGSATKFLNSDQSLVTYWTQMVAATHTILDTNNSSTSNALNLIAPISGGFNYTYTLQMPVNQGSFGQVLSTDGNNPAQLSWLTTITADVSLIYSATSCDNVNTIVLRDNNGSFVATNIALMGNTNNSLINYSTTSCGPGTSMLSIPGTQNIFLGTSVGNSAVSGPGNVAVGNTTLNAITSGSGNTAIGVNALAAVVTGSNNTAVGYGANVTGANALNQTAVGAGAVAPFNNSVVLGNAAVTNVVPMASGVTSLGGASNIWSTLNTYSTNYYDRSGDVVTIAATPGGTGTYTMYWPTSVGQAGYVLEATTSSSPQQLNWIPITALLSGTYCDFPSTYVQRDPNGKFAATTITLTGVSLLNYSTLGGCDLGNPFLSVPGTNNLFLGTSAGKQTVSGSANVAVGNQALTSISTGTSNTAIGYNALAAAAAGYNNAALGYYALAIATGNNNVAVGYNAGSASTGSNNIYVGTGVTGNSGDASVISIGIQNAGTSGTYMGGIYNTTPTGLNSLVGITSSGQLGVATSATITTLTVSGSLTVDNLNGAVIATNGLLTATIGIDGTRLASFILTDTPAVSFFQPVEPSRESYFFDDFMAFNSTAGDLFYGDTQWVIGNNTAGRVTAIAPLASNGAIGVTRLTSGAAVNNSNYITKQLTGTTSLSLSLGYGPCLNEWRVSVPATSSGTNSFYTRVGFGDSPAATAVNPTGAPSNGIYFQCLDSINSGSWTVNTASNGSRTSANTAVAPTPGVFQRLSFQVNGNASSVTFYINDVSVGTITTTIPTIANGNYCSPYASVVRNAGTGGSLDLDYWYFHYTFNSRR